MTIFLVSQHYDDDISTGICLKGIAAEIARDGEVTVLSGTPGSRNAGGAREPKVIEIPNWMPPKNALVRRGLAMLMFGAGVFASVLWRSTPETPVIVVTTPFFLPYAAVLAARFKRAPTVLIVHDLYPDALITAGLTSETSASARLIRRLNEWLYRTLDAIVIIGGDMKRHFQRYRAPTRDKLVYIPNWATLPARARPTNPSSPFRTSVAGRFVIGLSGNLGYTHDPETVFNSARRLADDPGIFFLMSGFGVGWERLKQLQEDANLPNVRMMERVPAEQFEDFIAAADAWIIPYRKHNAGISVPSRLYNLLAIGRPVIALSEPDSEHASILTEYDVGWVVPPEDPAALAETIRRVAADPMAAVDKGRRAAALVADRFTRERAGLAYRTLARRLSQSHVTARQR
jgi:colanic acid biosynthesis glycosyl transferase WcaI